MEDAAQVLAQKQALEAENGSLKCVVETLAAEKLALDQTLLEVLRANIQLKTGAKLLENKIDRMKLEIQGLNGVIEGLRSQLAEKNESPEPEKKSNK